MQNLLAKKLTISQLLTYITYGLLAISIAMVIQGDFEDELSLTVWTMLFTVLSIISPIKHIKAERWTLKAYSWLTIAASLAGCGIMCIAFWDSKTWSNDEIKWGSTFLIAGMAGALYVYVQSYAKEKDWTFFTKHNWRYHALFVGVNVLAGALAKIIHIGFTDVVWRQKSFAILIVAVTFTGMNIIALHFKQKREEKLSTLSDASKAATFALSFFVWAARILAAAIVLSIIFESFDWMFGEWALSACVVFFTAMLIGNSVTTLKKDYANKVIKGLSVSGSIASIFGGIYFLSEIHDIEMITNLWMSTHARQCVWAVCIYAICSAAASGLYWADTIKVKMRLAGSVSIYVVALIIGGHMIADKSSDWLTPFSLVGVMIYLASIVIMLLARINDGEDFPPESERTTS